MALLQLDQSTFEAANDERYAPAVTPLPDEWEGHRVGRRVPMTCWCAYGFSYRGRIRGPYWAGEPPDNKLWQQNFMRTPLRGSRLVLIAKYALSEHKGSPIGWARRVFYRYIRWAFRGKYLIDLRDPGGKLLRQMQEKVARRFGARGHTIGDLARLSSDLYYVTNQFKDCYAIIDGEYYLRPARDPDAEQALRKIAKNLDRINDVSRVVKKLSERQSKARSFFCEAQNDTR